MSDGVGRGGIGSCEVVWGGLEWGLTGPDGVRWGHVG